MFPDHRHWHKWKQHHRHLGEGHHNGHDENHVHYAHLKNQGVPPPAAPDNRNFFEKLFNINPPAQNAPPIYAPAAKSHPPGAVLAYAPNPSMAESGFGALHSSESAHGGIIVEHVKSGYIEIGGHTYRTGTGRGRGFANPDDVGVTKESPTPTGTFPLVERESLFFGERAWRIQGTPGHTGELIHSSRIGVAGGPEFATQGCVSVDQRRYTEFISDMDRVRPRAIAVRPD